ncbi:MAG: TolC family protein [Sedimentisphaerales bacterium]|nr:TolC family protein [Sedimentisphaerales bacterium]
MKIFIYFAVLPWVFLTAGCSVPAPVSESVLIAMEENPSDEILPTAVGEETGDNRALSVPPTPTGSVTLRQALVLALVYNPRFRAQSWQVRIAEARQIQAGLSPNPELEVEVEETGGSGTRRRFEGAETTILLSQVIELGDKRQKRIALATLENQLAQWDYESQRLDVLTEAAQSFIDVLTAQRRLDLMRQVRDSSLEMLAGVTKRVDAGKDSPVEQSKALVSHAKIKTQYELAEKTLHFARLQLASLWNSTKASFDRAEGDFDQVDPMGDMALLLGRLDNNPDLARWTVELEQRRAAIDLEKSRARQDIRIGVGLQRFEEEDENAVVFGFSIPLGISDRNQSARLEAVYALAQARQQQQAVLASVREQLIEAYQKASEEYTLIRSLEEEVLPHARSAFEASRIGYEEGKFDYLNVLDSQRTCLEAQLERMEAQASYHKARIQIERLLGGDLLTEEKP